MLLNRNRERVMDCLKPEEAECPLCGHRLVARRPVGRLWHWAHYPQPHDQEKCPHHESWWHLKMKLAALQLGWVIETPVELEGMRYLVDVLHGAEKEVIEFVHTLTPYYIKKYDALTAAGYSIAYLLDGEEFVSKRARPGGGSLVKLFLKPKARRFADRMLTAGSWTHVHVHKQVGGRYTLPLGEASKRSGDMSLRAWDVQSEAGWVAELAPKFEAIDLDDHKNNPEIIQDRVRKVEVKKLVEWL